MQVTPQGPIKPSCGSAEFSTRGPSKNDYRSIYFGETPTMESAWIFAMILLPAIASALPALPSGFSYPPITINIGFPNGNEGRKTVSVMGYSFSSTADYKFNILCSVYKHTDLSIGSTASTNGNSFSSSSTPELFNANGITNGGNTINGGEIVWT